MLLLSGIAIKSEPEAIISEKKANFTVFLSIDAFLPYKFPGLSFSDEKTL